jgi:uncharacterized protein (TIGR03437 family)
MPATRAPLGAVTGVAVDPRGTGDIYISDASNNMVFRVTAAGTLRVVAGNGEPSPAQGNRFSAPGPRYSGDGGPAVNASLSAPGGLAVDNAGNLYIADTSNNRVRRVTSNGIITTIAGGGTARATGLQATTVALDQPYGVAVDSAGNVYIAEKGTGGVSKVSPGGVYSGFAGVDNQGEGPVCVAVDANDNVYSYSGNTGNLVRISRAGAYDRFNLVFLESIFPEDVTGIVTDVSGNVYLAGYPNRIWKATLRASNVGLTVLAGNGTAAFAGDGGRATAASFNTPLGLVLDSAGNIYIADSGNKRIRKVNGADGTISTFAGNGFYRFAGDGGPAASAVLSSPQGMTLDAAGNLYIADTGNNRVRKVTPSGIITTVAGNGTPGFSGDGGPAVNAELSSPVAVVVDNSGNLYIADLGNGRVRKVSGGVINTAAGGGGNNNNICGGAALSATITPVDLGVDGAGNVFIALGFGGTICKVSGSTITAIPTTFEAFSVVLDVAGSIYFTDGYYRIHKIANNTVTTYAGTGMPGFSGDGGPAAKASLNIPGKMTIDAAGNLYVVDFNNNRVRKIDPAGIITSVAGGYFGQPAGDGGAATSATLGYPQGLAVSRTGDLYLADTGNHRIRVVLAKPPGAQVSPATMLFSAASGGAVTVPQRITVQADISAMAYTASVTTEEGNWLSVQPATGFTAATLSVTADPTGLDPGFHAGTITVNLPYANPQRFTIAVSFNVSQSLPPKLSVDSPRLSLIATQAGAAARGVIRVGNGGGGGLNFSAAASTDSGAGWLTVAPASGSASPVSPAPLSVTADPSSLAPGVYRGKVSVTSADTGEQSSVPVTLVVNAGQGQLLLSQRGMTFQAVAGGGALPAQNLSILNRGPGPLAWTAGAGTLSGGPGWLAVSAGNGTVTRPLVDASTIQVSADPTGLAAGTYYGQVIVSANGGAPAQTVSVVMVVAAAGVNGPQILPAALIFTGRQGDAPGSQNVVVRNPSVAPILFNSARLTLDGADWLQYIPQNASIATTQPQQVIVQPGFATLSAGVHEGAITFLFGDGSIGVVRVRTVVAGAGCTPAQLVMLPSNLPQVFAATMNLPMAIEVQVVDDCGTPLTADRAGAAVTASFSNGDRTINLVPTGNGFWTNTWQPVNDSNGPVYVSLAASLPQANGTAIAASALLEADLSGGANVPVLSKLLNAASLAADTPVAPGSLFSLLGSGLAAAAVNLAGQSAPLLLTSGTQINAQTPADVPVNTEAQVTVQSGGAISLPLPVVISAAAPAIFTQDGSGQGAGIIADAMSGVLNTPDNPAHTGDTVVISCTGLGAADNPVAVTIGGQPAQVVNVGPVAGMPGVYQVSAFVPDGLSAGTIAVTVTAAGQTSPTVTIELR